MPVYKYENFIFFFKKTQKINYFLYNKQDGAGALVGIRVLDRSKITNKIDLIAQVFFL